MNCSVNRPNRFARPSLAAELDKLFRVAQPGFAFAPRREPAAAVPPINVWEDEQSVYVESEVPGFTMENLDISITGGELTIRGMHEAQHEPSKESQDNTSKDNIVYHRRERRLSGERKGFTRTLRIGVPIDHVKVGASLTHGVLLIILPKSEAAKPRKIEVNAK